jgi:hypothetical protein
MNIHISSAQLRDLEETERNLYSRGRGQSSNNQRRNQEWFTRKHQQDVHSGMEAKVLCSLKDCLSRQIAEGVHNSRGVSY